MNMRGKNKFFMLPIVLLFLLILFVDAIFVDSHTFSQNASGVEREFEETITIEPDKIMVLDLSFSEGEEMEFIFYVEVEQELPIDVWFVNYANYVRLIDNRTFLFFIDGSQQDVTKATKIITMTQHDAYALVFANYNKVTVDVYLTYDINVYPEEKETKEFWKEPYIMLPLGLIIGILVTFLIFRVAGGSKKGKKKSSKPKKKTPSKKVKKRVSKGALATPSGTVNEEKTEEAKPEAEEKTSTQFCGNCGKPVETAFCPYCGNEVGKA
jgi:hypothetical protein